PTSSSGCATPPGRTSSTSSPTTRSAPPRSGFLERGEEKMEAASIAHADHHHGPPAAHKSSRVEAPVLGMLLFIISEVMIFGAFFTAYFFIRIVSHDPWQA